MMNCPMSATAVRLLFPETLWLEPEHYEQAREISNLLNPEEHQWQTYLNTLALLTLAAWLKERLPHHPVHRQPIGTGNVSYLNAGDFKLCLIVTEQVLDEVVSVPQAAITQPDLLAHFYVVMEVLEEQEQVIIRGCLRYDELTTQNHQAISSMPHSEFCFLPLSAFDAEIQHLVFYIQHSEPSTIPLPAIATPVQSHVTPSKARLSQWLQGVLDAGWQTIDSLINPEATLAWGTRQTSLGARGGKLINFGVQLDHQTVALLVTVSPESEGKIGISVQILPTGGTQFLPAQLKLALLSSTDRILQEVQSREQDNYIQLKPFKGRPGINFSIEVSLHDIKAREMFEL